MCDENKILKDFECNTMGELMTNVINIEFYRKVCIKLIKILFSIFKIIISVFNILVRFR